VQVLLTVNLFLLFTSPKGLHFCLGLNNNEFCECRVPDLHPADGGVQRLRRQQGSAGCRVTSSPTMSEKGGGCQMVKDIEYRKGWSSPLQ
jgi:hypothetical protein